MTDKTDSKEREALMEEFGFVVEEQSGVWTLVEDVGCTRPANIYERVLWKEVLAGRASLAANAGSEPVAWRYVDARGHFRYVGYKPSRDMAAEYPLLKPIRLYLHPSPPEGMVMVPREPTMAMRIAAKKADMDHTNLSDWMVSDWPEFKRIWDAMLKAAPPTSSADSRKGE